MTIFPITDTVRHLILILGSLGISFIIAFVATKPTIKILQKYKMGKQLRDCAIDGKKAPLFRALHLKKTGTPTMGGMLIWLTVVAVIIISRIFSYFGIFERSLLSRKETYLPLFTLLTVGILGAIDDYLNIRGIGKTRGLSVKLKALWLFIFSLAGAWWFYEKLGFNSIHLPGIGDFVIGWWYIPLFILVIFATANAVNFTDGLDGLAGGLTIIAYGAFGILAYAKGMLILSAFCAVVSGATMAFLWFNIPPAKFYMGDTGALALGATLGVIAMLTNQVMVLPLIGFIFVIETLSIIIQLFSKKFLKRKIFHIAPLHHHYEHIGWPEFQVTMRFWIIGGMAALLGLILGLIGAGV